MISPVTTENVKATRTWASVIVLRWISAGATPISENRFASPMKIIACATRPKSSGDSSRESTATTRNCSRYFAITVANCQPAAWNVRSNSGLLESSSDPA